jgi:hypothetical protein
MKHFILLFSFLLASCGGTDADDISCPPIDVHVKAINQARLPNQSLVLDYALLPIAQKHAEYQAVRQQDLDNRPNGSGLFIDVSGSLHFDENGNRVQSRLAAAGYPYFAEEIAAAGQNTIEEAIQDYKISPYHEPWLVWKSADRVGVGCAKANSGRLYWVHVIGCTVC